MKKIGFLLLAALLSGAVAGQGWTWDWVFPLNECSWGFWEPIAVDDRNNSYLLVTYEDSLVVGDTAFRHPYSPNSQYNALLKFDQTGHFLGAMDFYALQLHLPKLASVKPAPDGSLFIGSNFYGECVISDTTLLADRSDVFIGAFDTTGHHIWLKTIRGEDSGNLIGFIPLDDGSSVVIGTHHANTTPLWVNFFGEDSIQHIHTLVYVLKLTPQGSIQWIRSCVGLDCSSTYVRSATLGEEGNIYVIGETGCPLVFDQDGTPRIDEPEEGMFIFAYNPQGNQVFNQLLDWRMYLMSFAVDDAGNLIIAGTLYDTMFFANELICNDLDHDPCILAKVGRQNNLIWHHLYLPDLYFRYHHLESAFSRDTIYAALTFESYITIGDSTYMGQGRRSLILQYDQDGVMDNLMMLEGSSMHFSYTVLPDRCDDLLVSGTYTGKAWFGEDTLQTTAHQQGYMGRIRKTTHAIDLGPDTTIRITGSLLLTPGEGYTDYRWSTGATTSSIQVGGTSLGPGTHPVWVTVSQQGCQIADTVFITVLDTLGVPDPGGSYAALKIYPNPVAHYLLVDPQPSPRSSFEILDQAGRLVKQGSTDSPVSTLSLDPGFYLIRIFSEDHVLTGIGRFIKR